MSLKIHQQKNSSPTFLYHQLNQALNAEKHSIRIMQKKHIKKRPTTQTSTDNPFQSRSLALNSFVLKDQNEGSNINLGLQVSRQDIKIFNPMTPYQIRKKQDNNKIQNKLTKRSFSSFYKQKNVESTKKSQKEGRKNNFFKNSKVKTCQSQSQQDLAYSVLLKEVKKEQNTKNQLGFNQEQIKDSTETLQKCRNCHADGQRCIKLFQNQQIKKNIEFIEEMKKQLHKQHLNSQEFKHFPDVEILNLTYFKESKKKIITKINSRHTLSNQQKIKRFITSNKLYETPCSKCQLLQRKFVQQKIHQKIISNPTNFQYFVYQYQSIGQNPKRKNSCSNSNLCLQKNKPSIHKKNQKQNLSSAQINEAFEKFIKYRKINAELRPRTASLKNSQQIIHKKILKNSRLCIASRASDLPQKTFF